MTFLSSLTYLFDKFRDTLLSLQQNDVAPVSDVIPEGTDIVSLILQEMARSNQDEKIFVSPHDEENICHMK